MARVFFVSECISTAESPDKSRIGSACANGRKQFAKNLTHLRAEDTLAGDVSDRSTI
jgi:hypothetical protein